MSPFTRSSWRSAALVSMMVASATSCGDGLDEGDPPDVARSGVGVVAEGCGLTAQIGSGVIVEHDGGTVVVTVAHTIKGATSLTVIDADGGERVGRVIAFDKDADLAAIDVPGLNLPSIPLTANPVTDLDGAMGSIVTWGRDDGVEQVPVVITKRLRVTIEDIYVDEIVERSALEIAGTVTVGDSGGPVLNERGEVVGIVYANSRGRAEVGFATDQHELADLLGSVTGATVSNGTCF